MSKTDISTCRISLTMCSTFDLHFTFLYCMIYEIFCHISGIHFGPQNLQEVYILQRTSVWKLGMSITKSANNINSMENRYHVIKVESIDIAEDINKK